MEADIESLAVQLASLFLLGIGALWLSWRLRIPSILLLLSLGFTSGYFGLIDPDALLGDLLMPFVSVSVAIILFEGGLSLKMKELVDVGCCIRNLISIGAIITWVISTAAAHYLMGLNLDVSLLLGAILTVSGPTVIMPILRNVRPSKNVASILRWEAIVIDPIGAMFAAIVYEVIKSQNAHGSEVGTVALSVLAMIGVGFLAGYLAASLVAILFRHFLVPDFLQNPVTLMVLVATYVLSNMVEPESGLFAAMIMGIVLANRRDLPVKGIMAFKEDLSIMLLSFLFILLAAGIKPHHFQSLQFSAVLFLAVLILVARPLSVFISTLGTKLSWAERAFLAFLNPRGIVAAAVSSLFAIRLMESGVAQADKLVPYTFLVIVVTVAVYGLSANPLARYLGVAKKKADGFLVVGAHPWARAIAHSLASVGQTVMVVDTNVDNVNNARKEGLPASCANVMSEHVEHSIELAGIGRLLALTGNSEVNALVCLHFRELFSRSEIYQTAPQRTSQGMKQPIEALMTGRALFASGLTNKQIEARLQRGGKITRSEISEKFTFKNFRESYGKRALPLFLVRGAQVTVCTPDTRLDPRPGDIIIHLFDPAPQRKTASGRFAAVEPEEYEEPESTSLYCVLPDDESPKEK
jgi:NhaP-type Na+/H+ or K+/H+ antiporter